MIELLTFILAALVVSVVYVGRQLFWLEQRLATGSPCYTFRAWTDEEFRELLGALQSIDAEVARAAEGLTDALSARLDRLNANLERAIAGQDAPVRRPETSKMIMDDIRKRRAEWKASRAEADAVPEAGE